MIEYIVGTNLKRKVNAVKTGMEQERKLSPIGAVSAAFAEFMTAGFIGWSYETLITSVYLGHFEDRGVLPVPLLPIYAFFALFLSLLYGKRKPSWIRVFAVCTVMTTVFEYIAALVTEKIFGYMLWDYFAWPLNFQGRISLFSSLIFGAFSVLYVKGVRPLILYLHGKFPKGAVIATFFLALVMTLRVILSGG